LAELYGVETKRVNEAVRNNQNKFLEDFYFEVTDKEFKDLRSKNSTVKDKPFKNFSLLQLYYPLIYLRLIINELPSLALS